MKKERIQDKNVVDVQWLVPRNEMPLPGIFAIYKVSAYTSKDGELLGSVVGCSQRTQKRLDYYAYAVKHELVKETFAIKRLQEQATVNGDTLFLKYDIIENVGNGVEAGMKARALDREKHHIDRLRAEGFTLFNK